MDPVACLHMAKVRDGVVKRVLERRIESGAGFADLARKHAQGPSGRDGGNRGDFCPGQMAPEFDRIVFMGAVGVVHGPT